MKNLLNNQVIKNKYGQVRSGWIILSVMAFYYILLFFVSDQIISIIKRILIAKGEINLATGYYGPIVSQLEEVVLPIIMQIITDGFMIAIPLVTWHFIMKKSLFQMGLVSVKAGRKECFIGMLLGVISCSLIFFILLLLAQAKPESWVPTITIETICWFFLFILIAFAEELLNRAFFMSVLRRTENIYIIMLLPSVIFGCIHLLNPNVTIMSVLNIVLVGILFSYMFIKSGNIWMCIGYHFSWNVFQGLVYGMPVSGLDIKGIITTNFTSDTILNGGAFGIEGGILTTLFTILTLLFVIRYYRNKKYDFISDTREEMDRSVKDTSEKSIRI